MKYVIIITSCLCSFTFIAFSQLPALTFSNQSASATSPITSKNETKPLETTPATQKPKNKPPKAKPSTWPKQGKIVHTYNNVPIYSNGKTYATSHGKHYASDGYYYGHKWQCVEFVKRYYYDAHKHHMPNVWGHAKNFFIPTLRHGKINKDRNMIQFHNKGTEPPKVDDLIVWGNKSAYGHVAIISKVEADSVTIVQQNIVGKAVDKIAYKKINNTHQIGNPNKKKLPLGWLRIP